MEQLQQANVGNPENIGQSVQAAEYSPLKYQMELGTRLMETGFQGGSATNRQAMANQGAIDKQIAEERMLLDTERRTERAGHKTNLGTLTAIIAEFDDAIDNANMDDPAVARYMPAVIRKRQQLQALMDLGGRNPRYLAGILKQNETSQSLTPQKQAKMIDRAFSPSDEAGSEGTSTEQSPKKDTTTPSKDWHSTPSSNSLD